MDVTWLIVVLPAVAFMLTVFNALVWPRGRRVAGSEGVSVLIPARNEAPTIEAAVRSALAQNVDEVIVYNDGSTDETGDILAAVAAEDDRLRVVDGVELPEGWVGKPHACHRLAAEATGELLFFMDADVELLPTSLERIHGIREDYTADVVTAVPRQITVSLVERMILPLLHLTYVSWLPMPLIWRTNDPRFLAANGQLLIVSRETYDAIGGFAAVRDAVVDDMEFCRAAKALKRTVVFADGHEIASCRMYRSAKDVWEGFSKNIYEGVGSTAGVVFVLALYLTAFILPWIALPVAALLSPGALLPAAVAAALNVAQRLLLLLRHRQSVVGALLHPVAVLGLCAIAVNSWRWNLRDGIVWSGRTYAKKEARRG